MTFTLIIISISILLVAFNLRPCERKQTVGLNSWVASLMYLRIMLHYNCFQLTNQINNYKSHPVAWIFSDYSWNLLSISFAHMVLCVCKVTFASVVLSTYQAFKMCRYAWGIVVCLPIYMSLLMYDTISFVIDFCQ